MEIAAFLRLPSKTIATAHTRWKQRAGRNFFVHIIHPWSGSFPSVEIISVGTHVWRPPQPSQYRCRHTKRPLSNNVRKPQRGAAGVGGHLRELSDAQPSEAHHCCWWKLPRHVAATLACSKPGVPPPHLRHCRACGQGGKQKHGQSPGLPQTSRGIRLIAVATRRLQGAGQYCHGGAASRCGWDAGPAVRAGDRRVPP